jgi:hypothetical protein
MRARDDIGACNQQNPKPTTRSHDYVLGFSTERKRERERRGNPCPLKKFHTYPK